MMIDLHAHTNISDGTDTPTQLMERAHAAGLDVVALTDHDTTRGWDEAAKQVQTSGVTLVRGMEISCSFPVPQLRRPISVHLLSYLHDPTDEALANTCEHTITSRQTRTQTMVRRLEKDFPITYADVLAHAPKDGPIGRPHIADALVAAGCFKNRSEAFTAALHPSGKYYEPMRTPTATEAIKLVLNAGGVPVIAHPCARLRQKTLPTWALDKLVVAGLKGIECYHRDHTPQDAQQLAAYASSHDLLITGSSDYHGKGKPNRLGEYQTSETVLNKIVKLGHLGLIEA
ncbi:PHP domain-containing protein [Gleimia hominis]|uniref:PHP domain-containing protein n=1 Tax=Gleimia hominis TaxID=595468 RepID=A0ABU3IAA1_9ACTO|nr:PHP domain-containing protein [Gleimia hominis]MDT3767304.1 PHP domain-containing protein [Gleimia hominis]